MEEDIENIIVPLNAALKDLEELRVNICNLLRKLQLKIGGHLYTEENGIDETETYKTQHFVNNTCNNKLKLFGEE